MDRSPLYFTLLALQLVLNHILFCLQVSTSEDLHLHRWSSGLREPVQKPRHLWTAAHGPVPGQGDVRSPSPCVCSGRCLPESAQTTGNIYFSKFTDIYIVDSMLYVILPLKPQRIHFHSQQYVIVQSTHNLSPWLFVLQSLTDKIKNVNNFISVPSVRSQLFRFAKLKVTD